MVIYQDLHTPSAAYTFRLYPVGTDFSRIGGIYCFLIVPGLSTSLKVTGMVRQAYHDIGFYSLLYVGLTNNFDYRLKNHHKMADALALGMTHVGVMKLRSGRRRKVIERDLLRSLHPPLNGTFRGFEL